VSNIALTNLNQDIEDVNPLATTVIQNNM